MSLQQINPIIFSESENSARRVSRTVLCARSVISHNQSAVDVRPRNQSSSRRTEQRAEAWLLKRQLLEI